MAEGRVQRVHHPQVVEWRGSHPCAVLPRQDSQTFAAVLNALPWVTYRLDWDVLPSIRIRLDDLLRHELVATTAIGRYAHAYLMFSPNEPGIVAQLPDLLDGIDSGELLLGPHELHLCGAVRVGGGWELRPSAFAEYSLLKDFDCFTARIDDEPGDGCGRAAPR